MPEQVRRVGAPTDHDWNLIVRRIRANRCVPFLGAAASLGSAGRVGLPTGAELSERLAAACSYPGPDPYDLLRVAQYFQMVYDAEDLRSSIVRDLRARAASPGPVHTAIAAMPFHAVLTTNFDDLMERAFIEAKRTPNVGVYDLRANAGETLEIPTAQKPLVYKLHGSLDRPATILTTEDDIIEFLAALLLRNPDLPLVVKELFTDSSLLFIGYGLKDWNIRVMLRALRSGRIRGRAEVASFAIQRRPSAEDIAQEWEEAVLYWDRHESLRCFDMDATAFAEELQVRFARSA
jgi:hypothetical protein